MSDNKPIAHLSSMPLYTPLDFFLVRAPVLPASLFMRLSGSPSISLQQNQQGEDALIEACMYMCEHTLLDYAHDPFVLQALTVASSSLPDAVHRLSQGTLPVQRVKRVYASLLRYLVRMSTRPTPFGLFSGVAAGSFSPSTDMKLASPVIKRIRARPDMAWLDLLLQRIEVQPELVMQLNVRSNPMLYYVGERIFLPVLDAAQHRLVSIRATSVVHKTLEFTRDPITYSQLSLQLRQAFPRATTQQINHLLQQLWEGHILISDLHPPLTNPQPAYYILDKIAHLSSIDEIKETLHAVLALSEHINLTGTDTPLSAFSAFFSAQNKIADPSHQSSQPGIQVDTALSFIEAKLHNSIGAAAAKAAELLLRLTPLPKGPTHLTEYRQAFTEKYGLNAEVPLLELLSAENGLDAPRSYQQPSRTYQMQQLSAPPERDVWHHQVQQLVINAINERNIEVELDEGTLRRLESWKPVPEEAPLSLEIYLQIQAASAQALDLGEWSAVLSPAVGSLAAGRTFGRFFDLLEEPVLSALRRIGAAEEKQHPDAIFAELSYYGNIARTANVTIRPSLRAYEIVVGTPPTVPLDHVISLNDLVVGVQNDRFYLRSLRLNKQVIVCQSHMLNEQLAPNVCRFMLEISQDHFPVLHSFDWGTSKHSPFLPRLVYKVSPTANIVIAPAQWMVGSETIQPHSYDDNKTQWFQRIQHWREQWRVPRYVYMTQTDNRLLLDLEHPKFLELLQNELHQLKDDQYIALQELLPDFEHLWLQDEHHERYFTEIVVPLVRYTPPEAKTIYVTDNSIDAQYTTILSQRERSYFPGDQWIYVKLFSALKLHNEILAGPLQQLLNTLREQGLIDRWFYLRYIDNEPHLRLRFRASRQEDSWHVLKKVVSWCRHLVERERAQRYSIETYEREVERYGGPLTIDMLEQVFSLDSDVCSQIIAAQYTQKLTLDTMVLAVYTSSALFSAWGLDVSQQLQWLQSHIRKYEFDKEFRPQRKLYCALFSPRKDNHLDDLASQRALLQDIVQPLIQPLHMIAKEIHELSSSGKLLIQEEALLDSISHMHKVRLLNLERDKERQMYAFWYLTLKSLHAKP